MTNKERQLWQNALKYSSQNNLKELIKTVEKLENLDIEKTAKKETKKLMKAC